MGRSGWGRTMIVAVALALGVATPLATATRAHGQEVSDWSGWIALQVWDCPAGMTAETFDAWSCWVTEADYDVHLADAEWTPLYGLGDAVFDGWTHTWLWLPVGPDWAATPYRIVQASPPPGSTGWIVRYAMDAGSAETVWLSDVASGADLHVYNFYW